MASQSALKHLQTGRAIGWVLQAEGESSATFVNISSLYRFGDKTLTAVTGSGLVVHWYTVPRRLQFECSILPSLKKPLDQFLTTTAIESVGNILRLQVDPLREEDDAAAR